MLRLEVLDFEGPTAWRWRLTDDEGGRFLADREVRLDAAAWQFEAFTDLDDYVRTNAAPDRRAESEAELVAAVGEWIGRELLAEVGQALVAESPVTVRLEVPAEAEVLAYRPLELGWVDGEPLATRHVRLVTEIAGAASRALSPVGERLRMLAAFSLPVDATALNLRRERVELARLIHTIAAVNGKAIELRVVQYGVTRDRLEELMLEEQGWDVVHLSGHGLPEGLLLEKADGRRDRISGDELVRLLRPVARQLKLISLSSCESAALTASEHLRLLGIAPESSLAGGNGHAGGAGALPSLATMLAGELDCAVLAMRFPVADEFAIALARRLYDLVLGKGQPLPRALALTLPRVLSDPQMARAPAISVATPALFGARAAGLRLGLPPGEPAVFDRERQKLARFPPQPERFVGRVGAMSNATVALAPESGRSGILFHGMAGAGKTACALELAYTHEESFGRLVWHKAPDEDEELAPALSRFALDLEAQIPGLQLVHLVDDRDALRAFLPTLTAFLREQRVLIVIDNCESLLSRGGDWRDERWQLVIEALAGHGGLSRLVLTSRTRPRAVPPGMLVETVHALSIHEAVLLAREWPHLRGLLDGGTRGVDRDAARDLAARTLAMVQGHPKLIELADGQAADPEALRTTLAEADQAWLGTGVKTDAFLERGEPTAGAADYQQVLDRWTRGTTGTLPAESRLLFEVLCLLEPEDRVEPVLSANWKDIWTRLERPGEPAPVDTALAPLCEHALVALEHSAADGPDLYHLHPAVASAGRGSAGDELQVAVDHELADYWTAYLRHALDRESEELGWLVLRAARGGMPYLLRRQRWRELAWTAGQAITRDSSPRTMASILPLLRQAADAAAGNEYEQEMRRQLARALELLSPAEAEVEYRRLLELARDSEDWETAGVLTGDLTRLALSMHRLDEALATAEAMEDYDRRAGLGPWTLEGDKAQRLQILAQLGHAEEVLAEVYAALDRVAELPETSEKPETAYPNNVREFVLDIGRDAAHGLDRFEEALELNARQLELMKRRDAAPLDVARSRFNDYGPLLRLGRVEEARALLHGCRRVFEEGHDVGMLGLATSALADVEDKLGHGDQALRFEADALRLKYSVGEIAGIRVSHFNLSNYLRRHGGDHRAALAHRLAAAIIAYQTNDRALPRTLRRLAFETSDDAAPTLGWEDVCELVDRVDGVNLARLVEQLPARAPDGPGALAEVRRLAAAVPPEDVHELERHMATWEPVIAALVAARAGDAPAAAFLDGTLAKSGQHPHWTALAGVLRRIADGEQDPGLLAGLDPIDTAIARRALDAIAGRVEIGPWQ